MFDCYIFILFLFKIWRQILNWFFFLNKWNGTTEHISSKIFHNYDLKWKQKTKEQKKTKNPKAFPLQVLTYHLFVFWGNGGKQKINKMLKSQFLYSQLFLFPRHMKELNSTKANCCIRLSLLKHSIYPIMINNQKSDSKLWFLFFLLHFLSKHTDLTYQQSRFRSFAVQLQIKLKITHSTKTKKEKKKPKILKNDSNGSDIHFQTPKYSDLSSSTNQSNNRERSNSIFTMPRSRRESWWEGEKQQEKMCEHRSFEMPLSWLSSL